jgi:DoxX-like protein
MTQPTSSPAKLWTGRVLSAIPAVMMIFSASLKLRHVPMFMSLWTSKFGWQEPTATTIGIVELSCVLLYVFPPTSVLGAIVMAGYLGGATATHVRIGDNFVPPVVLGVIAWLGLYLREPRLAKLVPLRRRTDAS